MQYLGERRVFEVVEIREHTDKSQAADGVGELGQNLSQLDLSGSDAALQSHSLSEEFNFYKITGRSKFKILAEPLKSGGCGDATGDSPRELPISFVEVGGLKKQIQTLKELVLHPLKVGTNKGNRNISSPKK